MKTKFATANSAFRYFCQEFSELDKVYAPRGIKVKEFPHVSITIENPYKNFVYDYRRKTNFGYLIAELIWYLSRDTSDEMISRYAPFWKTISDKVGADKKGYVHSNYGVYCFEKNLILDIDESQFDWCKDALLKDNDTRQAIININQPYHKGLVSTGSKDFPCTTSIQFFIRDMKLNCMVHMRSTDFIKGFCNDVYQFTQIQKIMLNELKKDHDRGIPILSMGEFTLYSNSFHLYEKDFEKVELPAQDEKDDWKENVPEIWQIDNSMDAVGLSLDDVDYLIEGEKQLREGKYFLANNYISPEAFRLMYYLRTLY